MDIEEKKDFDVIEFLNNKKIDIMELRKKENRLYLEEIVLKLKKTSDLSGREISRKLGIGREIIRKILSKELCP